ncbi:hypothetical protein AK812_SmicGene7488 [Symbiodinium microadriaticum]|uniref:Uncharacterized protein n=1 Tax=Symbiodinium microadriaticum TaxID=2951 RepID=A0A1Q9ENM4_SYMMI|nr:hypothetical protein AK812_SmicGene7488 [Symbiodinium microadriaticum]
MTSIIMAIVAVIIIVVALSSVSYVVIVVIIIIITITIIIIIIIIVAIMSGVILHSVSVHVMTTAMPHGSRNDGPQESRTGAEKVERFHTSETAPMRVF